MLDVINEGINFTLFGDLRSIYNKILDMPKEEQQKIFHEDHIFTDMKPYYDRFVQECNIKPGKEALLNKQEFTVKWNKILSDADHFPAKKDQISEWQVSLLDGIFLYELGKFDEALQKLSAAEKALILAKGESC